jgi:hypothetical protein
MHRRTLRLEALLRKRPECQVLPLAKSQNMDETLIPRLLDLLAEKTGDNARSPRSETPRARFFSNILTSEGAAAPFAESQNMDETLIPRLLDLPAERIGDNAR